MKLKKVLFILLIMLGVLGIYVYNAKATTVEDQYGFEHVINCPYCGGKAQGNAGSIIEATCTRPKYACVKYKCNALICGRISYMYKTISPSLGHNWLEWVPTKSPTCTAEGTKKRTCQRCGAQETATIPAYGEHNWVIKEDVPSTCTTKGYKRYECSRCHETKRVMQPLLSHVYVNGICSICQEKDPYHQTTGGSPRPSTSVHIHEWQEATCENPKTCLKCGEKTGTTIAHSFNSNNICTMCGRSKCAINGHVYNSNNLCTVCGKTKCQNDGAHAYEYGVCERCGQLEDPDILNKWPLNEEGTILAKLHQNGTLEITGDGQIVNFNKPKTGGYQNPITGKGRIKKVEIKGRLETIPSYMFYYCQQLTEITIAHPDDIRYIGEGAFFGCSSLKSFDVPENITAIGGRAFCHCRMLQNIDLTTASKLVRIGHEAFRDCWRLKTVKMPEGLKIIGYEAFFNCISLQNVFIPSTVVSMGTPGQASDAQGIGTDFMTQEQKNADNTTGYNNVFGIDFSRNKNSGIEDLKSFLEVLFKQNGIMDIEDELSLTIENGTWQTNANTEKLQNFLLKPRVWYYTNNEVIKDYIEAQNNNNLELIIQELKWDLSEDEESEITAVLDKNGKLTIEGTGKIRNFKVKEVPWNSIRSFIKSIEVKNGITSLGEYLFYYSSNLTSVSLPSTLKEIQYGVFFGCSKLQTINLPNSLEFLGGRAFCHAEALQSITLPEGITSLKGETFRDCYSLKEVKAQGNITSIGIKEFFNDPALETIFKIPCNLKEIGEYAFEVDFTDEVYEEITTYKASYNNGNYTPLIIEGYIDCMPLEDCAERNRNDLRDFNFTYIKQVSFIEGYKQQYIEGEDLDIYNMVLNVEYDDGENRQIEGYDSCIHYDIQNLNIDEENISAGNNEISVIYDPAIGQYSTSININVSHDWLAETGRCLVCGKECEHSFIESQIQTIEPTCDEPGKRISGQCEICGYYLAEITQEPLGHDYEEVVTKEATCTEKGIKTYTCKHDSTHTYTEEIPALGHNYVETVTQPTCTEKGYTTHTCTRCQNSYKDTYVNALGHDYESKITKEATCTEEGIKTYTCKHDSTHTYTEEIPALGHDYESRITKQATCEEKGIKTYTCTNCGETKTEEIPALGHDYKATVTAPTCTEKGYTTHRCTRCQNSYKDTYVNALGHNYENGKCTRCNESMPQIEIRSDKYTVNRVINQISNVSPKTKVQAFLNEIKIEQTGVTKKVYNKKGEEITNIENTYVGTGMKISLYKAGMENPEELTVIVTGDIDGNGDANFLDMIEINKHRLKIKELEGVYKEAGDVNKDNKVDFFDMIELNKYRLGIRETI